MLRAVVTTGFLVIAALILWLSFVIGVDSSAGTLFINLGTEIVGIVITVAVVEWFFERRRFQVGERLQDLQHPAQSPPNGGVAHPPHGLEEADGGLKRLNHFVTSRNIVLCLRTVNRIR